MVIGIVTAWFPSGAGSVSKAYVEALIRDHEVYIYARGGNKVVGLPQWDYNYVHWAPYHTYGIRITDFVKWIKINKIDVLFFNEQRYWKPVLVAKKLGVIVGAYVDYYTQNTVDAFAVYDFLICNTKRHYSVFSWHKNCFYVPWGTDIEKYKPVLPRPPRTLTFVHNMGWQGMSKLDRRGTIFVLRAFRRLPGDCRLLLFSQRKLNDCLPLIQEYIKSDSRIKFIYGTFDPVPYTEGDVFVYPSRLDGIGLTLPEALSCGLPAITTDAPPMNEFVKENENGQLVKIDKFLGRSDGYYWPESICNENSLFEAMTKYFDKETLEHHSSNARRMAISELNWTNNRSEINRIFVNASTLKTINTAKTENLLKELDHSQAPSFRIRFEYLLKDILKTILNIRNQY